MSNALRATVEKQAAYHSTKRWPPSQQKHYNRLSNVISSVSSRLNQLAQLGRSGQWILHHEDLYNAELDTRPQSRKNNEEVPVRGLTYNGIPVRDRGLIWAGKEPAPDFRDIAFWEGKIEDLDGKINQIKARSVQPHFTPEELQTIESLEQQPHHFFRTERISREKRLGGEKNGVFNVLFSLARLGRPGQWVLHNEELYHPAIDTRPQTRASERSILVRDSHYNGHTRLVGDGLFVTFELFWAGNGPQPNFDDFFFWEYKSNDLKDKIEQVERGQVNDQFTPEDLRTLEALEREENHAFTIFTKEQVDRPPVVKTPEELAASMKLAEAREVVSSVMGLLWYSGLPGKWVLHCDDLYLPMYDTHSREQYEDDDVTEGIVLENIALDSFNGLRFDTRFRPPPDFTDPEYWKKKIAELQKKEEDVEAGRLTVHNFTKGDLMRIELLERAILNQTEPLQARADIGASTDHAARGVQAWLNKDNSEASPAPEPREQSPPTLPNQSKSETSKTKRSADDDDSFTRESTHHAKTKKVQPIREPLSTTPAERHASLGKPKPSPPLRKASSRSLSVPSASPLNQPDQLNARAKTESQRFTRRGTRRMGVPETESSAADRQNRRVTTAQHGPGQDSSKTKRHGSPGNLPPRRSARITALSPRRNL